MTNRYLAFQMIEIHEHRYYLTEKNNDIDVGLAYAVHNWQDSGHAKRFWETYQSHKETIEAVCNSCNKCENVMDCRLPNDIVHKLMED